MTDIQRRQTLKSVLQAVSDADRGITTIDPEAAITSIRDEVDYAKAVLDRLEANRAWAVAQAKPFLDAAAACDEKAAKVEAYVLRTMQAEGFEKLTGHAWRVRVKVNPASMKTLRQPDEDDDPRYAELYTEWRWRTKAIKDDLKRGKLTFDDCEPWAMLFHRTKVEFEPNLPEIED